MGGFIALDEKDKIGLMGMDFSKWHNNYNEKI
jgi:hypothetical protein